MKCEPQSMYNPNTQNPYIMKRGEISTLNDQLVEFDQMINKNTARIFQLDENGNRIKKFKAKGYLMGVMTVNEYKSLNL